MARTLRLDADHEEALREIARIDGIPVSEEIRQAIAAHIERRRKDRAFQARLRASLERHQRLLEILADR
jgi:predicted transcriptional regulator